MASSKPSAAELLRHLIPAMNEWRCIGLELGIEDYDLEGIKKRESDEKNRLRCMLSKWLEEDPNASWDKIIAALRSLSVYKIALADDIATRFLPCSSDDDDDDNMELSALVSPHTTPTATISTNSAATSATEKLDLSDKGKLSKRLRAIEDEFNYLTSEVMCKLESINKIDLIGRFCCNHFKVQYKKAKNIDELFNNLDRYLSFLNTNLYDSLRVMFMKCGIMKRQINRYKRHLGKFTTSTTLSDFKKSIESLQKSSSDGLATVELRLGGNWDECTVSNLVKLKKSLFPHTHNLLVLKRIHHSILTVIFTAPCSALLFLITDVSKRISYTVYRVGVLNIQVSTHKGTIAVEPTSTYINPEPPLIYSSMWDEIEDVELLLELLHEDPNQRRNKDGATALILASYNGCTRAVERLLQTNADVDLRADNDATALMMASHKGRLEITRLLLEKEADTSVQDKVGDTALILSFKSGSSAVTRLLLQHGADPNIRRIGKVTPLMMALHHAPPLVEVLLQYKAKPNEVSNDGNTALVMACENNHIDAAASLLRYEADPTIAGKEGITPLLYAAARGNKKIVQTLLDHPQAKELVNVLSDFGTSPLGAACISAHEPIALCLLKASADPDLKMSGGETALMKAVIRKNQAIVRLLLQFNANVDLKRDDGATALYLACEKRDERIFKMLLRSGADPNQVNEKGVSVLATACFYGYREIFKLLLQSDKTRLNVQDSLGATPLVLAAQKGFDDIVSDLLERKADPKIPIKDGRTALTFAAAAGHHAIADMLIKHGAIVNTHTTIVNYLSAAELKDKLSRQSYVDMKDGRLKVERLMTPLVAAVTNGHIEVVRVLLKVGADINEIDPFSGTTSLVFALVHNKPDIAQLLLDSGADVSVRDYDDGTALDVAIELKYNDIAEVIKAKMKEAARPKVLEEQQSTEKLEDKLPYIAPTELVQEIDSKKYIDILPLTTETTDEEWQNKINRREIMSENWEPPGPPLVQ